MQKCPLVQSAFLSGFWTDLRHQYGIFGGESQTSLFPFRSSLRDVNERRLYSQAMIEAADYFLLPGLKNLVASRQLEQY